MIAVVQRVRSASVTVAGDIVGRVEHGLVALTSIHRDDGDEQIKWMADKLAHLRIFRNEDASKDFDRDVMQISGAILLVSNFTVAAETKRGRRPTLEAAADPVTGRARFDQLVAAVRAIGLRTETGVFGADMLVTIENDGPATFIISTKND